MNDDRTEYIADMDDRRVGIGSLIITLLALALMLAGIIPA